MSDRVNELESQLGELQAAIDGLTEELVEVKARLRELEDEEAIDVESAGDAAGATAEAERGDAASAATAESQSDDVNSEESTEGGDDGASEDGDIIIA